MNLSLLTPPPLPPPGVTFPFSVANDMLAVMDGLTQVVVKQIEPTTGAVLQTATATALKKITGVTTVGVDEGEIGTVSQSRMRLWASTCPFVPKYRDQIVDAEGVTWQVGKTVRIEGFGGFYVADDCVQVKTQ